MYSHSPILGYRTILVHEGPIGTIFVQLYISVIAKASRYGVDNWAKEEMDAQALIHDLMNTPECASRLDAHQPKRPDAN